ncbi:MAG: hypothetical protein JWO44_1713 [Bacteroidetes bacterium]|nr:hypothetical protein [Bacteroidota bacterium]
MFGIRSSGLPGITIHLDLYTFKNSFLLPFALSLIFRLKSASMKKLLCSFLLLSFFNAAFATHNMAGQFSYTHLSGNTYEFTVKTFTNTSGTTADRCELIIYFGDGDSAIVPRSNGPSGTCSAPALDGIIMSHCSGPLKYNVYVTAHTYAAPGTYMLRMDDPNRSAAISNIAFLQQPCSTSKHRSRSIHSLEPTAALPI